MIACYACHRLTRFALPHGAMLPVYCPDCLREVGEQILQDLAAEGRVQVRVRPPIVKEAEIPY